MTLHVLSGASTGADQTVSNVIYVAPCPIDKTLCREKGTLGPCTHFCCTKCGTMFTLTGLNGVVS